MTDPTPQQDPVTASNEIFHKHPIDFYSVYADRISRFAGVATSILYGSNGSVSVALSSGNDGKPVGHYFDVSQIVPFKGSEATETEAAKPASRYEPDLKPEMPVEFLGEYEDIISGYKGRVTGVVFSANKCIQVELGRGDKDNNPEFKFFDIQNLKPVGETKAHGVTSDMAPGSPVVEAPQRR